MILLRIQIVKMAGEIKPGRFLLFMHCLLLGIKECFIIIKEKSITKKAISMNARYRLLKIPILLFSKGVNWSNSQNSTTSIFRCFRVGSNQQNQYKNQGGSRGNNCNNNNQS
jgi:hypothetical protein